jgi:hypothetical protein
VYQAGIFQDVALDDGRRDGAVIALADQRDEQPVLVGRLAQLVERLALGHRARPRIERRLLADRGGHVSSISASRLSAPITASIAAISFGEGPIWRRLAKS